MIRMALVGNPNRMPDKIKGMVTGFRKEAYQSMSRLVMELTRKVKQDKLSGQVLNNRTGRLRRSIHPEVQATGRSLFGRVGTNVIYAAIHEYGGDIYPKTAKALRFQIGDRWITTQHVKMPERSFLRTALAEMEPAILAEFSQAVSRVFRK